VSASPALPRRPWLGRRTAAAAGALCIAIWAAGELGLGPRDLLPAPDRLGTLMRFLGAALRPALDYEAQFVPAGVVPFPLAVVQAVLRTVAFALGGFSLALVLGIALGLPSAASFWTPTGRADQRGRWLRALLFPAARSTAALLRSVHELLWAVLFLAALGASPLTGAVAIALPYGGTLAKIFAEQLDEAPRDGARALAGLGATRLQQFAAGLLPRAAAQLGSYSFYRFECAVRSAAVLGFFGYPTLGYHLSLSFDNLHFREVWTFLYALIALVLVLEFTSARLRWRLVR
jgi:phosphonate transport system permease protein